MAFLTTAVALLGAGYAAAQLEGRGFPDCSQGPLSSNDVCDTSLGMFRSHLVTSPS